MSVVVVSDSSSRLGADERKQWNIREVPLHVLVEDQDLRDGVDEIPYDIHDRAKVTTAGATPAELTETYRQALADSGGDGVVAVHLSSALSSTYSAAVSASREFGAAVRVVNSRSAAMGVGFVAKAAARSAAAGADLDTVEDAARAALSRPSRHFKAGASERSPPLWPGINAALTLQGDADRFTREARAGKGV